jgi:hypothetical protein
MQDWSEVSAVCDLAELWQGWCHALQILDLLRHRIIVKHR